MLDYESTSVDFQIMQIYKKSRFFKFLLYIATW